MSNATQKAVKTKEELNSDINKIGQRLVEGWTLCTVLFLDLLAHSREHRNDVSLFGKALGMFEKYRHNTIASAWRLAAEQIAGIGFQTQKDESRKESMPYVAHIDSEKIKKYTDAQRALALQLLHSKDDEKSGDIGPGLMEFKAEKSAPVASSTIAPTLKGIEAGIKALESADISPEFIADLQDEATSLQNKILRELQIRKMQAGVKNMFSAISKETSRNMKIASKQDAEKEQKKSAA